MPVPEGMQDLLQNPGMVDQLTGLLGRWQQNHPQAYQRIADQAGQAWTQFGPSLMSQWQGGMPNQNRGWPRLANFVGNALQNPGQFQTPINIAQWDIAAGAPQNIWPDMQSQGYGADWLKGLFKGPGKVNTLPVVPQQPAVGQGNASQAPGLQGSAAGLDQSKQNQAQVPQPGMGNQPR